MTQAFNLAQLANKVNTSGQLDASTGLVNAVPVANGGLALSSIAAKSIPVANVANTYTTVTPGASQSVRINAGNTAWEAFTPGTVTSVSGTGGLTGTITSSGSLSIDTSTYAIGQIISGRANNTTTSHTIGSTIAGTSLYSGPPRSANVGGQWQADGSGFVFSPTLVNTGTWKAITTGPAGLTGTCTQIGLPALWVRIS